MSAKQDHKVNKAADRLLRVHDWKEVAQATMEGEYHTGKGSDHKLIEINKFDYNSSG